ncbi:unnamed protein product [Gongylonema pulchrum]|uniref:G_PROTEIN_RECEP_F1_2 domain-containing protein n=1 Tax=Gongylonema pulchrum TaxID=637853 RepID=A0A183CYS6_9BILA|nr:unnamed protein product [Gongylonema pulchrum]
MMVLSVALKCAFGLIFVVIIVVGILGNIFVATIILDQKLYNTSINLFLLSLAIADLGNLLACCPDVAQTLIDRGWRLPAQLCPLLRFLQEYFLYASVLTQVFLSEEHLNLYHEQIRKPVQIADGPA